MMILAFDATAGVCAAALVCDGEVIASQAEAMEKGHAERLFPMIREMMDGHDLSSIDAVAVCTGPGNFTGARIGVAAARGLALSLGARSIGVDRFECAVGHDDACIVLPGRGASVHAANYDAGTLTTAATIDRTDLPAFAGGRTVVEVDAVDLAALARVAAEKLSDGDAPRPAPRYLRPVNAALPSEAPPPLLP
ncbi:MAG: tRNA (adenosine(37)-N6)-threonylcarbamoyltransferase complex dimerization subunit type 1 TsaB [Pikeienuella sp.]